VRATVEGGTLHLRSATPLGEAQKRALWGVVGSCLRFDLDLRPFWEECRSDPDLRFAADLGAGRFLRAPTAFADAAMVLATTNCSWALTRKIVGALVGRFGREGAFPEQEAIAAVPPAELRRLVPLGYRAPYLSALARGPSLEPLREDRSDAGTLRKRLLELPGFGPYAAENMLRLLGRFDYPALDSWVLRRWREEHPGRADPRKAIERRFARFGGFAGLALWLHVTRRWYGDRIWSDKFGGFRPAPAPASPEAPPKPIPRTRR